MIDLARNTITIDGVEYIEYDPTKEEPKKKRMGMKEFSKKVIVAITVLWFIGAIYASVIIWRNNYGLEALLSYIGAPVAGGVISYMLKTAFENKEKEKTRAAGLNNCNSQDS